MGKAQQGYFHTQIVSNTTIQFLTNWGVTRVDFENEYLQERTNELWSTLNRTFPQADIRFQREEGSTTIHILFRDFENHFEESDSQDYSVSVDIEGTTNVTTEAIFSIKEVLKLYDS